MSVTLTRADVVDGLREIVARLRAAGHPATIQVMGGAAITLTIDGDRPATKDIDVALTPPVVVRGDASEVGQARGWPAGWLDENARVFLPSQFGRGEQWVTIRDDGIVVVQVASPEMLLAMKLVAMEKRFLRDADDTAILLSVTGTRTAAEADELVEAYYPGDNLSLKVFAFVERVLDDASPAPHAPERLDLT